MAVMTPEITNFMQFALEQAFFAIGESRPNPAVGAVVVKDGIVVGKGRTQRPGSAHAEVMALRDAGELARGASIFVTLEPCCHYGRTPPCTKAIIEAGIQKVYFAHSDPNPVVHGFTKAWKPAFSLALRIARTVNLVRNAAFLNLRARCRWIRLLVKLKVERSLPKSNAILKRMIILYAPSAPLWKSSLLFLRMALWAAWIRRGTICR